MPDRPIRVMLAEDHGLVRSGLRALLEQSTGMKVVGEAANGRDAVKLVASLAPDIVLLDVQMPELNGLLAARRIKKSRPHVRIVMLSMFADAESVRDAIAAGASGYLVKAADEDELEMAVRAVMRGDFYLSPRVSRVALSDGAHPDARPSGGRALTPRQREVLQLIAEGLANKQIAAKLGISVKTVESHRARLMRRLGVSSVAELVRYAGRTGLISL